MKKKGISNIVYFSNENEYKGLTDRDLGSRQTKRVTASWTHPIQSFIRYWYVQS